MTKVKFLTDSQGIYGFSLCGHSSCDCDDDEGRFVCATVSSAAYMAANTISEIVGDDTKATVDDAFMEIEVNDVSEKSRAVLEGFKLHITELSLQYPDKITIISEV